MTTHKILIAARALIADEANWTKGEDARDKDGEEVDARDDAAVCFCAGGAIVRITGGNFTVFEDALYALHQVMFGDVPTGLMPPVINSWNDAPERTHAEVLAGYDRAIKATA